MERVKVVMQTQGKTGSIAQAARGIWAEGGLASLYRGTVATLLRDIPGSAVYFGTYEATARALRPTDGTFSLGAELFAGGMAGVAMV
jgi:solute carrier family 25 carnitine/acylcarnitine transporter 20/29